MTERHISREGAILSPAQQEALFTQLPRPGFRLLDLKRLMNGFTSVQRDRLGDALIQRWKKEGRIRFTTLVNAGNVWVRV